MESPSKKLRSRWSTKSLDKLSSSSIGTSEQCDDENLPIGVVEKILRSSLREIFEANLKAEDRERFIHFIRADLANLSLNGKSNQGELETLCEFALDLIPEDGCSMTLLDTYQTIFRERTKRISLIEPSVVLSENVRDLGKLLQDERESRKLISKMREELRKSLADCKAILAETRQVLDKRTEECNQLETDLRAALDQLEHVRRGAKLIEDSARIAVSSHGNFLKEVQGELEKLHRIKRREIDGALKSIIRKIELELANRFG